MFQNRRVRPISPGRLMVIFWLLLYLIYFLAPIEQFPPVSGSGILFVWTMVGLFVAGSLIGSRRLSMAVAFSARTNRYASAQQTCVFLSIGIVGALLSLYEKTSSIGILSLLGAAELRAERAQDLMEAGQLAGGVLSGLAFLSYPAGFVGMVASVFSFDRQPWQARALTLFFVLAVFLHSVIAGGRATIFVLLILVALTFYMRRLRGLSLIPDSKPLRLALVGSVAVFLVYSSLIWQVRSAASELGADAFLRHAELVWEVRPLPWLEALAEEFGGSALLQTVVSTLFYFTQCFAVVERVLLMDEMPLLFGGYQVDLIAAAMRTFPSGSEFLARGYWLLLDANIYGFFASAWGSLLIDFGWTGAVIAALLWGWLAGSCYRQACERKAHVWDILYIFVMYSVLISFVSPPLGFANSAVSFGWFIVFAIIAISRQRIAQSSASPAAA